jgi:hypothetical protein
LRNWQWIRSSTGFLYSGGNIKVVSPAGKLINISKHMSYLDKTVYEVVQKITAACDNSRHLNADGVAEEMGRIEKLVREKLVESFKNGIEVGKGRKAGRNARTDRKPRAGRGVKPGA